MKKLVCTLNIGDHIPEITAITYPLLRHYAKKIGASFDVITERKHPFWDVRCEKLQLAEIQKATGADWVIYIDADAVILPEAPDFTTLIGKDTVLFFNHDFSLYRFRPDNYFRRDSRAFGAGNWFCIASDWTAQDLWQFPHDLSADDCAANIFPTSQERAAGIDPPHLTDDYILSRNIARYGLKTNTVYRLWDSLGFGKPAVAFHQYLADPVEKLRQINEVAKQFNLKV